MFRLRVQTCRHKHRRHLFAQNRTYEIPSVTGRFVKKAPNIVQISPKKKPY
jgi:hypothetical protein